jgi:hypothetical protein
MSTQRKIDSARANGAKSRGPITEQGRKTSSMNALKHGLTAKTVVLSNENDDEYTVLLESYVNDLQPTSPVEMDLVTEMANAKWQQRRLSNIESELFEQYMEKSKNPESDSHNATVEHTAAFRIMSESTSLTMLNRMAARLERTYARALNNLLRLRQSRTKDEKRTQSQPRTPTVGQASWPVSEQIHQPPEKLNDFPQPKIPIPHPLA